MTIAGIPLAELVSPPWRRYVIESRLARELVVRALTRNVGPKRWFHSSGSGELFEGSVSADGFRIRRIAGRDFGRRLHYRNPFLPLIIGRFGPSPYGTRIAITMRPLLAVMAFWLFWMGAVGCVGVLAARHGLRHDPRALAAEPVVLAMMAAGYLVGSVLFGMEAHRARPIIDEILTTAGPRSHPTP